MNSEIINAKIEKRILVTDAPIFSGETVKIKLDFDCGEAVAAKHKIVLFGDDKKALAEGTFFASESAWFADLNMATNEMAAYFAEVPVDATKSVGAMVINTQTADVITRGNVLVVSTPFPENLSPCPQTYAYLTVEEFSSSMAEVEAELEGKADASDFVQLSSDVADLSNTVASKADSSTVADLSNTVASKADSSTVAALSSAVGDASLIVRRNQYGGVGTGGEVKDIILTGDNEEYPMIEFNDEARGGDYYVFMPNGPEGDGGDWHEFYLPNKNGTIALDTDLESKAESSTVADLAEDMRSLAESLADLDTNKADASTVDDLAADLADKADSSTVADLAAEVAALPNGYTVTFANDFSTNSNQYYYMTSAPVTFVFADGTSETIDVEANKVQLRGRALQNVTAVVCKRWSSSGGWGLQPDTDYTRLCLTSLGLDINLAAPTEGGLYGDITPLAMFKPFAAATVKRAYGYFSCLLKGTLITLADGRQKPIEAITHDDNLLVWDFDNGCLATAKPLWIKRAEKAPFFFKNTLEDGRELCTFGEPETGGHRMFDADKNRFIYTAQTVGDGIYTIGGIVKHKSCFRVDEECEYFNVITERNFNLFANGILTSCRLNNLYPIDGMKFAKAEREPRPFEAYNVPLKFYVGLRLAEQCGEVEALNEYVSRLAEMEA